MRRTSTVTRRQLCALGMGAVASAALLAGTGAAAQDATFPDRPIKIVLMFPAGNGLDTSTRNFADALSKEIGQPVVVDNKPGANGVIAFSGVKMAPADGY